MKLRKETNKHGKWYGDACGTAFALELIGERWALLIMREMMFGPRRFTDLRAGLPGISAKALTERLESLEQAGMVQRRQLPPPAATQVYELTEWGYRVDVAIMELGRWAAFSPGHDPTLPLSAASLMMSFRTMFDPSLSAGVAVVAAINIGVDRFQVTIADGLLRAERAEPDNPGFALSAPEASVIAGVVYGKIPCGALAASGLSVAGDLATAQRFIDLFHLPPKIG
jgi:DNA-binding HxlR family transcriptional regulator